MTQTTPDLTSQQLAACYETLAKETVECPYCPIALAAIMSPEELKTLPPCSACQGSGRVARFPGFRHTPCDFCGGDETSPCEDCDDKRYLVRAGGLHDALAGLDGGEKWKWFRLMPLAENGVVGPYKPSASEILLAGLRGVIEVAGLEVNRYDDFEASDLSVPN